MRFFRQLRGALLGAVVLVALMLGTVGPASAHDTAESTSPADGATLTVPPERVSVTFDHNPLALGSQILVADATGANWADGPVEIVDNVAAQKLRPGAPAGRYTVRWRVASSDGHPIEGSFTFTATAAATGTTAAAAVPTLGTAQPGITPTPTPVTTSTVSPPFPWSVMGFVAVGVGILVALGLMAKRRLTPDADTDNGTDTDTDS
jgi:methionine-rich copper-binding protein CopC